MCRDAPVVHLLSELLRISTSEFLHYLACRDALLLRLTASVRLP